MFAERPGGQGDALVPAEDSGDSRRGLAEKGEGPVAKSYRLVPDSFAEFSLTRVRRLTDPELLASGSYGCEGCGEHGAFGYLTTTGELLCEGCLRYQLGYEQAEENNVRLIVGSAVAAALAAGASEQLVRVAVDDALFDLARVHSELDH